MKIFPSIIFVCFVSIFSLGQKHEPKYVTDARNSFLGGRYDEASGKAEKAYNKLGSKAPIKDRGEMAYMVAEANRQIDRLDKAKKWYSTAIDLKYYQYCPEVYFYKGEMLRMEKDFQGALDAYADYKPLASKSMMDKLELAMESCTFYEDFDLFEGRYVLNEEEKINTKAFDMVPFAIKNSKGTVVYYGSSREESVGSDADPISGEKYMDIYMVKFDQNGDPTGYKNIDANMLVNTGDNEGTFCFDSRYKTAYFTRCKTKKGGHLGCEIWMVNVSGKPDDFEIEFEEAVQLNLKPNDTVSIGHPCIIDDKYLVFASDMTESNGQKSYGGKDLWYVEYDRRAKTWGTVPMNMGPEINSAGDELFPSFHKDTRIFYFSSNGHKGIGGMDMFRAKLSDTSFAFHHRMNMGYPFNSQSNDYAISVVDYVALKSDTVFGYKEKYGFFTTERKSADFKPDIWSFDLPPLEYSLQVMVYEMGDKSKKIEDSKVEVSVSDGDKWDGLTGQKLEGEESNWGKTELWAVRGKNARYVTQGKEYTIKASKAKYITPSNLPVISTVNEDEGPDFYVEIPLIPIEIRTPEVRYPLDQWSFINDASCMSLDSLKFLVNLMKDNPTILIELYSHTDARDTEKHNQALSQNRAVAVYKHLVSQGIEADRIRPIGMGENEPAVIMVDGKEQVLTESYINTFRSNKKEFERLHQINRRTTVKVLTDKDEIPLEYPKSKIEVEPGFNQYISPLPR